MADLVTITDSKGRKIDVQRLKASEQMRVMKAAGDSSMNMGFVGMLLMAASVRTIDGVPVAFPKTEADAGAILDRLDDHGYEAVQAHFSKSTPDALDVVESAKN